LIKGLILTIFGIIFIVATVFVPQNPNHPKDLATHMISMPLFWIGFVPLVFGIKSLVTNPELDTDSAKKTLWNLLAWGGIFVIFFAVMAIGICGATGCSEGSIYVGLAMTGGGAAMIFFGRRNARREDSRYFHLPTYEFLKNGEQIVEKWPYKVKTGFASSEKYFAILTNQRIICADDHGSTYGNWQLSEIKVVPTRRSTNSRNLFRYGHVNYGDGFSAGSGSGLGKSNVVGDLEVIQNGKVEYVIPNISDPDGIATRIVAMQESVK
jgi:hypothetical protein